MSLLHWFCERCPLREYHHPIDRRKVSPEGRQRYEDWQRDKADVEKRLELVDMQIKVIDHVTNRERNA